MEQIDQKKAGQSGESKLNFNESSVCCYQRKINHYPAQNKKPEEYHTRSGWQPDEKVRTCMTNVTVPISQDLLSGKDS